MARSSPALQVVAALLALGGLWALAAAPPPHVATAIALRPAVSVPLAPAPRIFTPQGPPPHPAAPPMAPGAPAPPAPGPGWSLTAGVPAVALGLGAALGALLALLFSRPPAAPAPLICAATVGEVPRRAAVAAGLGALGLAAGGPSMAAGLRSLGPAVQQVVALRQAQGEVPIPLADILRLVFHDTVTFDPETRTGGCNGSIRFPEELGRPENAGLAPAVATLLALQRAVREETGVAVSFTDVMAVTGQYLLTTSFKQALCAKTDEASCGVLYNGYGNKAPGLRLGRVDGRAPEPEGRVPWRDSPVGDFRAAAQRLGLTAKELCCLAPALLGSEAETEAVLGADPQCRAALADLAASRLTTTRTSYEVNCFRAYAKLVNVAVFNEKQYAAP